jgi:O-methyltransferase
MATQIAVTDALAEYVRAVSVREDEVLRELREVTAELPAGAAMQVSPEEGQFLALLAGVCRARTVVEVGTFTGYATLCLARAVGAGGRVLTCDVTTRWADIGRGFWERAGVAGRIELLVGPAALTLPELGSGIADLVFIDADKANYRRYFDLALDLIHDDGVIVVDNTLYFGKVVDPSAVDFETEAIREFNAALADDDRVEISLLPVADGITLARKR